MLRRNDPAPVTLVNGDGLSNVVLCCEHAGRAIPAGLGDLGLPMTERDRHIGWDIGAEGVARVLSGILDAPLVLQRYSRLVVDCNRPFAAPDAIPEVSDGTPVPGNANLDEVERRARFDAIHAPFHEALGGLLDRRMAQGRQSVLVAIHSFVPQLTGGAPRPWHLGALSNRDGRLALAFLDAFRVGNPDLVAAHNQPYEVDDLGDYTIPVHGERRGLPHVLIEIRHDGIAEASGQARWAGLIARALTEAMTRMELTK